MTPCRFHVPIPLYWLHPHPSSCDSGCTFPANTSPWVIFNVGHHFCSAGWEALHAFEIFRNITCPQGLICRRVSIDRNSVLYFWLGISLPWKMPTLFQTFAKRAGSAKVLTKKHGTNLPVLLIFAKFGLAYVPTTNPTCVIFFRFKKSFSKNCFSPQWASSAKYI